MLSARQLRHAQLVLASVVMTLLVLIPLAVLLIRRVPPEVVTVDLQLLIDEDTARYVSLDGRPPEGREAIGSRQASVQRAREFGKSLSAAVADLELQCDCIIVNRAAMLGSRARDLTDEVRARVIQP